MRTFFKQLWCGLWHGHVGAISQESITWTGHGTIKLKYCPRCGHSAEETP